MRTWGGGQGVTTQPPRQQSRHHAQGFYCESDRHDDSDVLLAGKMNSREGAHGHPNARRASAMA